MSKALYDLVDQISDMDDEVHEMLPGYIKDFNTMLLVEPIMALADTKALELKYRKQLVYLFREELDSWNCIPEYTGEYLLSFSRDRVCYAEKQVKLTKYVGDCKETLSIPIFSFEKLRKVQDAAYRIVNSLNAEYATEQSSKAALEKEKRRQQFEKLKREFGE